MKPSVPQDDPLLMTGTVLGIWYNFNIIRYYYLLFLSWWLIANIDCTFQSTSQCLFSYVFTRYKLVNSEMIQYKQVRSFEARCGSLSQYGMKHMRSFANICNAGISKEQMAEASAQACVSVPPGPWSSLHKGFTAWWWKPSHSSDLEVRFSHHCLYHNLCSNGSVDDKSFVNRTTGRCIRWKKGGT